MRYDDDHKIRVRKRVLAEATSAFWSLGPQRVAVTALMARLGLTHGGFYSHFSSKDELIAQSITRMFDQSCAWLASGSGEREPVATLAAYIDFYLSERHSDSPGRGCALPAVATDVSRMGRHERDLFAQGTERLCGAVAELFQKLGKKEEEAASLAFSLLSEMSGVISIARAIGLSEKSKRLLAGARRSIKNRFELQGTN
ncbi:TetR/AcrR family transcriptional repressor of nem operon [Nitrobacteraceae bacterium AZCC 2161]